MKFNLLFVCLLSLGSVSAFAYGTYLPGSCEGESISTNLQSGYCKCKVQDGNSTITLDVACHTVRCEQFAPKYNFVCKPLVVCNMVNVERAETDANGNLTNFRKVLCRVGVRLNEGQTQDEVCTKVRDLLNTHRSAGNYCQTSKLYPTAWIYDRDNESGAIPLPTIGK